MASNLATLLKDARAKSGLTQEQLAKKAANNLTANDISRAERGMDVPTDPQLKSIAKVTGVTQKSLLDAAKTARTKTASTTAKKTTAAAKKTPASSAKTTSSAKKTTTAKTSTAKSTAKKTTSTAKNTGYTLTATEKKLIDAYRSASSENKKLALNLLQGKAIEDTDEGFNVGSILQNSLSSGLGGVLETLISGLSK